MTTSRSRAPNAWADRLSETVRQVHKAGDKCFVDYGNKGTVVDRSTGERVEVELFIAVMGTSNDTAHTTAAVDRQRARVAARAELDHPGAS